VLRRFAKRIQASSNQYAAGKSFIAPSFKDLICAYGFAEAQRFIGKPLKNRTRQVRVFIGYGM